MVYQSIPQGVLVIDDGDPGEEVLNGNVFNQSTSIFNQQDFNSHDFNNQDFNCHIKGDSVFKTLWFLTLQRF